MQNSDGVTVIFVAVVLLVMIGMASLAIDIGYVAVKKNEIQNAADAAALAAVSEMASIYPINNSLNTTQKDQIRASAEDIADSNLYDQDYSIQVDIKSWQSATVSEDSVKVTIKTSIEFFFGKVLGVNSAGAIAEATAALAHLEYADDKDLIPVGISSSWFGEPSSYCGGNVTMYPVTASAPWHNFEPESAEFQKIKQVLYDMYNNGGGLETNLSIGDKIKFRDDTEPESDGDVYDWFRLVYETAVRAYNIDANGNPIGASDSPVPKKVVDENGNEVQDEWYDPLGGTKNKAFEHLLPAKVIVFNPSSYEIEGYAKVKIKDVYRIPDKSIAASVLCSPTLVE